ncbi:dihydroorotase/N-acyl-D-amino-acid deacylase [Frondihabitans sp. PhB188]|nr:dihydroorotase/N-acyl-D-amino-acid deacylase [Frondihabitans sp. PhB188]
MVVEAGLITAVEAGAPAPVGAEVVDASGRAMLPGFIDAHSHDDAALFRPGGLDPKTGQGVTTTVLGNCGLGVAPSSPGLAESATPVLGPFPDRHWPTFGDYLAEIAAEARAVNTVALVPHAPLRAAALGFERRPATAAEVDAIAGTAASALDAGAAGISLGLMYAPGDEATRDELLALATAAARHDRLLVAHIRNEADHLRASIDEMADLARATGARLHISHLKVTGPANAGGMPAIIDHLDALRDEGIDVTADVYPYDAGSTTVASLFPPDAQGALVALLSDPTTRRPLLARLDHPWPATALENQWAAVGPGRILLAGFPATMAEYEGLSVAAIAASRAQDPLDALADLVVGAAGQLTVVVFHTDPDGVRQALAWPHTLVGSDGLPREAGFVHPRLYGTFPRALTLGVLPFDAALARMTSATADRFGLARRGRIEVGAAADLQLVDLGAYADRATYDDPRRSPAGLAGVWVGGVRVGAASAGQFLRPAPAAPAGPNKSG